VDGDHLHAGTRARHDRVDAVLDDFFALAKRRAESVGWRYVDLWSVLERNSAGGKRFRPRMVFTVYDALGGADDEAVARVGAAFELLHTALIVHDDVIDRDFSRRGIPNVSGSYRDTATTAGIPTPAAEHRGMSAAVIAGDLALTGASRMLLGIGCADHVRTRLLDLLDEAIFVSAGGEMVDVEFSLSADLPTVDEILEMERAKTAVYSFEAPLQAGAVLAGAGEAVVTAVGDFGREVGVAYQVVDDLLGVFGTEEATSTVRLPSRRSPTPRPPTSGSRSSPSSARPTSARPRPSTSAVASRSAVPAPSPRDSSSSTPAARWTCSTAPRCPGRCARR
jgi:geranylgeranyl diphosphate synthase type II